LGTIAPFLPLSTLDFLSLNHSSFYDDPAFMVDILESDYGMANIGQARIRIEAFIEMVRGGLD